MNIDAINALKEVQRKLIEENKALVSYMEIQKDTEGVEDVSQLLKSCISMLEMKIIGLTVGKPRPA